MKFSALPDALKYRVPEPLYLMVGCTPLVPHRGGVCPTCKGLIGLPRYVDRAGTIKIDPRDHYTVCLRCDAMDAGNEQNAKALVVAVKAVVMEETASHYYKNELARVDLTERERRRIFFGSSRAGYDAGRLEVVNRANIGQAWLRKIDRMPDWNLILDRHGNIIGRNPPPGAMTMTTQLSVSKTATDILATLPINMADVDQPKMQEVLKASAQQSIKSNNHPFMDMVGLALHALLANADVIFKSPEAKLIAGLLIKMLFPVAALAFAPTALNAQGLVASASQPKPDIVV